MRHIARFLVALAAVGLSGCGAPLVESGGETANGAVIGHLQSRNHKLTLHASADGARFTVRANDGHVIASDLSLDELSAQHPELFRLYQDSVARPVDASLTQPSSTR
ncbi:MAG TPA: hypothetical protein VH877_03910 [Polyangia bacterium]|jgi:hypothetical protein|nr:hypothetical protein [Polyangia bacterium]